MLLYFFAKSPSGNVEIHGAECNAPQEIIDVESPLSANGYQLSDSAEYVAQITAAQVASDESKVSGEAVTQE